MRRLTVLLAATLIAGCAGRGGVTRPIAERTPAERPLPAPKLDATPTVVPTAPATAAALPLAFPGFAALPGWPGDDPAAARTALRAACPALMRRADASGLTRAGDWDAACAAAGGTAADGAADARAFFEAAFAPVLVGGGRGLTTGYFELTLGGARARDAANTVPLYGVPSDLVQIDLGRFSAALAGKHIRGRVEGASFVPYPDRAAIEDGALAGRGLEIAWAADPVEAFFLEIQGSGRVALADGSELRLGYAGQNGRDYTAIGRLMRHRGLLAPGPVTMQGIVDWLHAHPEAGRALMRENQSYVFFRVLRGPGPVGALGIALAPDVNVAADPAFVPLGAPLFVRGRTADGAFAGVRVAADTGGAIKGANRLDLFFGHGDEARRLAGAQAADASVWLLLPRAAVERLRASRP